ncbi:GGDEF domain-containing protein [Pseudorhodoferax sp. Leaf267]|uniref:GGDEF domain-containing protein n=1 Tax=Pseudorhodoferax sp. Leaf267 TaxID=1736316 RepID=UPI0006FA912A|nr:diguanylate cyclase [Pseudorhodoferax sp. Leaf267]KQP18079.1 hypothetical protein ASF43_09530 [Pseudorhodoferax sp. Leaf267]
MRLPVTPPAATDTRYGQQLHAGFKRLRFEPALEQEFRAATLQASTYPTLVALLTGTVIWLMFCAIDVLRLDLLQQFPDWSPSLWQLVVARVVVLLALAVSALVLWSGTRPYRQWTLIPGLFLLLTIAGTVAISVYRELGVPHDSFVLALVVMAIFLPLGLVYAQMLALAVVCIGLVVLLGTVMPQRATVLPVPVVLLATAAVSAMGAYIREYAQREQFLLRHELQWQASRDALTGLFNRREFNRQLDAAIPLAHQSGQPVALVLVDVDHFKLYNDSYGHQAGDLALQRVAHTLEHLAAAHGGRAFRTGGEEMALVLHDATAADVQELLARLPLAVQSLGIEHAASPASAGLSVSAGCALLLGGETAASLYKRADQLLYQAKSAGRDRVVLAPDMGGDGLHRPGTPHRPVT